MIMFEVNKHYVKEIYPHFVDIITEIPVRDELSDYFTENTDDIIIFTKIPLWSIRDLGKYLITYAFKNSNDAILFKLKFGGI